MGEFYPGIWEEPKTKPAQKTRIDIDIIYETRILINRTGNSTSVASDFAMSSVLKRKYSFLTIGRIFAEK